MLSSVFETKKLVFVRKGTLFMTTETEAIKVQILSTGNAEILLEENDFLIVKWIKPEIKYSMAAYQYGKTGMANNYPWECSLTEEQIAFFLEHINAAVEYFKSKHHYFHLEVNEVSYENIVSIDEHGIKFSDLHWLTYKECTINFKRKYPNSRENCIGERNITVEPPYIELYSTYAHTKILFNKKGLFWKNKNMIDFHNLQRHINEFGYTTLDLS